MSCLPAVGWCAVIVSAGLHQGSKKNKKLLLGDTNMDWLMYVAFMPFLMPLVIIGVGMTGVELFRFFRRNPRLGRSEPTKALGATFLVIAISLLILFLHALSWHSRCSRSSSAVITIWYFGCAVYFMWKWGPGDHAARRRGSHKRSSVARQEQVRRSRLHLLVPRQEVTTPASA